MFYNYIFKNIIVSASNPNPQNFMKLWYGFMNVYSRIKVIFVCFFFWVVLFHLISLNFYIIGWNIINFILKGDDLNFETK